jgi:fimbrial chaperone protein
MNKSRLFVTAMLFLGLCAAASASSFGLSPMRVELSAATPTAIINVSNSGDAAVTIQAQAYVWTQPEGKDTYEETRGFIISPPIFTLAPGARQIVRIAMRGAPPTDVEQAYRLMFREVPQAEEATGTGIAFRIAVGMNIPMFVAPVRGSAAPKAVFAVDAGPDAAPRLRIANEGTGNLRLSELVVSHGDDDKLADLGVFVVLPGATGFVALPKDRVLPGKPLRVQAQSNGGSVDLSLPAAKP